MELKTTNRSLRTRAIAAATTGGKCSAWSASLVLSCRARALAMTEWTDADEEEWLIDCFERSIGHDFDLCPDCGRFLILLDAWWGRGFVHAISRRAPCP